MDWYQSVFELIDMRSFSNLWFWIALAVLWSSASHWVLGVPWDMVTRARRGKSAQSMIDLNDMVRINTNRILYITREAGLLMTGFICFVLTALFLIGFIYGKEFAQAVFLLGFPMTLVALLSIRSARHIRKRELADIELCRFLHRHRLFVQLIGMLSIFVTAMWGMVQNMTASVLF